MEHIASGESGMNTLEGFLSNRPPDLAQSLHWAIQFCHGMEHAYSRGVKAHRDIKPANIMIDQHKIVKITDFGLAGIYAEKPIAEQSRVPVKIAMDVSMQTAIGTSIGTPEYMSPEQFDDLSACDERSDIYSFGIVLYRMAASGKLPFKADNPVYRWAALKHYHQEAIVPTLTSPLFSIILRCLEKKSENRYKAFKELHADLEALLKQLNGELVKLPELKELEAWELCNKGLSLESLGKYKEAIACQDKALVIDPRLAMAWYNKGVSLGRLGKNLEAIDCFDRALEFNPKYLAAWFNKGVIFGRLDKGHAEIACYDKALEIDPNRAEPWINKGFALGRLGEGQKELDCFDKALEINPRRADAWYSKGYALGRLGKAQEAIICYDKALEIDPRNADAWYGKGRSEDILNRTRDAIFSYNNFLKIAPEHKLAAAILERIELLERKSLA